MNLTATTSSGGSTSAASHSSSNGGSTIDDLISFEESFTALEQQSQQSPVVPSSPNRTQEMDSAFFYEDSDDGVADQSTKVSSFVNGPGNYNITNSSSSSSVLPSVPNNHPTIDSNGIIMETVGTTVAPSRDDNGGGHDHIIEINNNNVDRIKANNNNLNRKLFTRESMMKTPLSSHHHHHSQMAPLSKSNLLSSTTTISTPSPTTLITSPLDNSTNVISSSESLASAPSGSHNNNNNNKPSMSWLLSNPYSGSNTNSKLNTNLRKNVTKAPSGGAIIKSKSMSGSTFNSLSGPSQFINSNNHHQHHQHNYSPSPISQQYSNTNNRLLLQDNIDSGDSGGGVSVMSNQESDSISSSSSSSSSSLFISSHDIPILIGAAVGGIILLLIIIIVALVWYCCEWNLSNGGDNYSIDNHSSETGGSGVGGNGNGSAASRCSSFDRISCPGLTANGPSGNVGSNCGCGNVRSSFGKLNLHHHLHGNHRHSASNCLYINNPNSVDSVDMFKVPKSQFSNLGNGLDFNNSINQFDSVTNANNIIPRSISVPLSRSNSNSQKNDSSQNSTVTSNGTTTTTINSSTNHQYFHSGGVGRSSLISQAALARNISTYYENQKKKQQQLQKNGTGHAGGVSCLLMEPSTLWSQDSHSKVLQHENKKSSILSNDLSLNMDLGNCCLNIDDNDIDVDDDMDDRSTATWKINDDSSGGGGGGSDQMPLYRTHSLPWPDNAKQQQQSDNGQRTHTTDYQQVNQPAAQFGHSGHCQTMGRINFTKKRRNRMRNDSAAAIALNRSGLGGSLDWDHPFVAPLPTKYSKSNRSSQSSTNKTTNKQEHQPAPSVVDNTVTPTTTTTATAPSVGANIEVDSKKKPTRSSANTTSILNDVSSVVPEVGTSGNSGISPLNPDTVPAGPIVVYNERTAL